MISPEAETSRILEYLDFSSAFATGPASATDWATPAEELSFTSLAFVREGLAAFFTETSDHQDSIARRLKNALLLMIESDNQSKSSIGLALSVTAIEAMLCTGDGSQQFKKRAALMLEFDQAYRIQAENWIGKRYRDRSAVLHGSKLSFSNSDARWARLPAGMVLWGMLQRRKAIRRTIGEDESPGEFFKELDKSGSRYLTHIPPTPLHRHWRRQK